MAGTAMSSLLAIASQTARAVWRLRAGWLLALLLGILLVMPFGPVGAEVRILGLLGPGQTILVIAALWLAADLASREFDDQTILLLAVRPISHSRILVGRWLGVLASLLPLLLLLGAGLAVRVGVGPAGWSGSGPVVPDFAARADRLLASDPDYLKLADPLAREELRRAQIGELRARWQTVAPLAGQTWQFPGLASPAAADLSLVLTARMSDETQRLEGRLRVGPPGQPGPPIDVTLVSGEPCRVDLRSLPQATDTLEITFENRDREEAVAFPPEEGPRIVWRAASFAGNLLRLLLVVAGQLAFLSALGLLLGSLLSFPVAAFCGMGYLGAAGLVGLVSQRLWAPVVFLGRQGVEQPWLERLSQLGLQAGYWLTAPLNLSKPVADLAEGVAINGGDVWLVAALCGVLGSWILLQAGGWLLGRRELGGLMA